MPRSVMWYDPPSNPVAALCASIMILAHKAATGFEGGSYHITLRGILQSSIQPLGIAVHGIHLIGVAEDLHHQGLA